MSGADGPRERLRRRIEIGLFAVAVVSLSIIAGYNLLRGEGDRDAYKSFYDSLSDTPWALNTRFEPIFVLIAWVFSSALDIPYEVFATLLAGISLVLIFRLLQHYSNWPLPLVFAAYVATYFPLHQYNQVRTALAAPLCYFAVRYASKQKWTWCAAALVVAIGFQYSSALFVAPILYVAAPKKTYKFAILIIGIVALALSGANLEYLLRLTDVNPLVGAYLENSPLDEAPNFLSGRVILFAALLVVGIGTGILAQDAERVNYFWMSCASLALYFALAATPVLSQRISELLAISAFLWAFTLGRGLYTAFPGLILCILSSWMLFRAFTGVPTLLQF